MDGGQLGNTAVAVQVLGGPAGHDPLQLAVVGFAALWGGVVGQAQGHTLLPQQQLTVCNLKPEQIGFTLALWPFALLLIPLLCIE